MPQVHVTAIHNTPNQRKDATIVWLESISTSQFEVCLKESRKFEGLHRNLTVVSNMFLAYFKHNNVATCILLITTWIIRVSLSLPFSLFFLIIINIMMIIIKKIIIIIIVVIIIKIIRLLSRLLSLYLNEYWISAKFL